MTRPYYGRYYPGMFIPLNASIITLSPAEQAEIAETERELAEETARYNSSLPLMVRFTRRVYKAIETEYTKHPEQRAYLAAKLAYWAKRLRHYEGRDWEVDC